MLYDRTRVRSPGRLSTRTDQLSCIIYPNSIKKDDRSYEATTARRTPDSSHVMTYILMIWKSMIAFWLDENPVVKRVMIYLESDTGILIMRSLLDSDQN